MCGGKSQSRVRACSSSNGSPVPLYDEDTGCQTGYSGCSGPYASSCGGWGQWSDLETCPSFQICQAQTSPPSCACSGTCYPAPTSKPLNEVEQNVLDQEQKIKLPVKLDWEGPTGIEPCTIDSYQYRVAGDSAIENSVTESEVEMKNCTLASKSSYSWQAKACLQGNCGKWSDQQNFSTSLAPELLLPYDPDWEKGSEKAEGVSLPVKLDWCDVKEAQSWLMYVLIRENGQEVCHPWLMTNGNCDAWPIGKEIKPPPRIEEPKLLSEYLDEKGFFTKATEYIFKIAACLREDSTDCSDFSQQWRFKTGAETLADFVLIEPPDDPRGETPVGLPLLLDWQGQPGMNSFNYSVGPLYETTRFSEANFDYPQLSLNTLYQWAVEPCWDYDGQKCETALKKTAYFKTTGRPPAAVSPLNGVQSVAIPLTINWEDVPGAKSYVIKITGDNLNIEKSISQSEIFLDYPEYNIRQEKTYSWQVKTCARENGQVCGNYSQIQSFTTFRLPAPTNPSPENNGQLATDEQNVSWQTVPSADAYQYKIRYLAMAPSEIDETCRPLVGSEIIPAKTVSVNSDAIKLGCLGQYQWQSRSCLDQNCTETSNWSEPFWTFSLTEPQGIGRGGLVPCGRAVDNPKTPWNEREPCQIRHLIVLVKTLVDFFFGRVIPAAFVILTIASAIILYVPFASGGAMPLAKIKMLWRSAGISLLTVAFAWLLINWLLSLIGYQISIFGNWYQL